MPVSVPVPDKAAGDLFTEAMWDSYIRDNINKLLNRGHRVLTVAQFAALVAPEGTKGTLAPDEVYLEVDAANGIIWHFAYESGEATYKWRFLGGPPLTAYVDATEDVGGGSVYKDLATVGPSITTPRAGDYELIAKAMAVGGSGGGTGKIQLNASTGQVGNEEEAVPSTVGVKFSSVLMQAPIAAIAGTATVKLRYWSNTTPNGISYGKRALVMSPVRIRHDA